MNSLRHIGMTVLRGPLTKSQNNVYLLKNWYSAAAAAAPKIQPPESSDSSTTPIPVSTPVGDDKVYSKKLVKLVDEIGALTLLEVGELNELLKKTLKLPDVPMGGGMMMMAPGASAPTPAAEDEEEVAPVKVQTSFTVKLLKFDETKKVALIKEVKSLLEGMNLVQAKKFVESAPTIVKADVGQADAEKLAAALTAAGGTCEVV